MTHATDLLLQFTTLSTKEVSDCFVKITKTLEQNGQAFAYQGGEKSFLFFKIDRVPAVNFFAEAQSETVFVLEFVVTVPNKKNG